MEVIGKKPVLDIAAVQEQARKEFNEGREKKARELLKDLYTKEEKAKQVLRNIEREIVDALADISDGNLT